MDRKVYTLRPIGRDRLISSNNIEELINIMDLTFHFIIFMFVRHTNKFKCLGNKIRNHPYRIWLLIFLVISTSCNKKNNSDHQGVQTSGIMMSNMDTLLSPKTDFYSFVNGGWEQRTTIPSDEGRWGSFNEIRKFNDSISLTLVDKALKNENIDPHTDEGKVATFFRTAMDIEKLSQSGIAPIRPILDKINNINSTADVLDYIIDMEPYLGGLFGIKIGADPKNSNVNTIYLVGGKLGLPDRDYYISDDNETLSKRDLYVDHISIMLHFLDIPSSECKEKADRVLAFETKMAEAMLKKEDRRDPLKTYNPKSLREVKQLAPKINWNLYFKEIGAADFKEIIVDQPKYIQRMDSLMFNEPIEAIKDYLTWCLINDASIYLSPSIEQAHFNFYKKTLLGTEVQRPRNERVLSRTNRILGEAIGKLYIKEYFSPEAKKVANNLVDNILNAFGDRIKNLDWMSGQTKKKALLKLSAINVKIGYPDKWKDFSKLKISGWEDGGSYYKNILNARKWTFDRDIIKIGKDVDKSEWFMPPQTVNAYYNHSNNEIVFPAAILQPPFFDFKADPAVNFGGIGAIIGHEISHGFDDRGSQYDGNGNLNNWWTDADRDQFNILTKKLIKQFNGYQPLKGIHINGEYTLGENIGDLGGVFVAYDGLKKHYQTNRDPGLIDGFTQDQRFFINWTTIWRSKYRDEALKVQIKTGRHTPGRYRAIGSIVNMDAFHQAFDIQQGDKMYIKPADRIEIW